MDTYTYIKHTLNKLLSSTSGLHASMLPAVRLHQLPSRWWNTSQMSRERQELRGRRPGPDSSHVLQTFITSRATHALVSSSWPMTTPGPNPTNTKHSWLRSWRPVFTQVARKALCWKIAEGSNLLGGSSLALTRRVLFIYIFLISPGSSNVFWISNMYHLEGDTSSFRENKKKEFRSFLWKQDSQCPHLFNFIQLQTHAHMHTHKHTHTSLLRKIKQFIWDSSTLLEVLRTNARNSDRQTVPLAKPSCNERAAS